MPPPPLHILILGAGITGLTTALAITKHYPLSSPPRITIFELRPNPSTIGGAINLTPNALRYLDHLGVLDILLERQVGAECETIEIFDVYSGRKVSEIDFRGPRGQGIGIAPGKEYKARRVMRKELQGALLEACRGQGNVEVVFGRKTVGISEDPNGVRLRLEQQIPQEIRGDLLLGCDGIHSVVRTMLVDPDRKEEYTGVAVAQAFSAVPPVPLRWKDTMLASSRRGSLMASYFEETRTMQYVAAVMEMEEVESRDGWRVRDRDRQVMRDDILARFRSEGMEELEPLVNAAGEWILYPVYKLGPKGKWISPGGKALLLGDAAHAMPPQGESTGIAIEDAIVFARTLMHLPDRSLEHILEKYQSLRKPRVDAAYDEANFRWETVKDSGWLMHRLKLVLTPWVLWWSAGAREQAFAEDLTGLEVTFTE